MKKIIGLVFQFAIFLLLNLIPLNIAQAATCTVTTSPSSVTTNDRTININIKTTGLVEGNEYWIRLDGSPIREYQKGVELGYKFRLTNGLISVLNVNEQAFLTPPSADKRTFKAKSYTVSVQEPNGIFFCTQSFSVQQAATGGLCQIDFSNPSPTNADNVTIKVSNLSGSPNDGREIIVKRNNESGPELKKYCNTVDQLTNSGAILGKFEAGNYYVQIRDSCLPFNSLLCHTPFAVNEPGSTAFSGQFPIPPPPCQGGFCKTAFGNIETDLAGFIKSIFTILLSFAGVVAVILIIVSGYRYMTSQGNPEKVQEAREQLTSAVVGLLFIIFSFSILQIIGVDILKIPGFER